MICCTCKQDQKSFLKGQSRCLECSREANKKSYYKNRDKRLTSKRAKYDGKSHYSKYKVYYKEKAVSRYMTKKCCMPTWLSNDYKFIINEVYNLAKLRTEITGFNWHVDHIVPIQGKEVCGLHVPWNLQVIPATLNISKSNKF